MTQPRSVFFVSDRTGITVETLGRSLLSQFADTPFARVTLPFVDNPDKARAAAAQINAVARESGLRPLVFCTLVDPEVHDIVAGADGCCLDLFADFIGVLESELGVQSSHAIGRTHGLIDAPRYNQRMDAVNFALTADDGAATQRYAEADLILVGVSRSGKTPTCLYLALQYGLLAANYPVTDDDLEFAGLPPALAPHRARLFGLTIAPARLREIRQRRRADSRYADLQQCQKEVRLVESMFREQGIPSLDTTQMSVEEIASSIVHKMRLAHRN